MVLLTNYNTFLYICGKFQGGYFGNEEQCFPQDFEVLRI